MRDGNGGEGVVHAFDKLLLQLGSQQADFGAFGLISVVSEAIEDDETDIIHKLLYRVVPA